MASDNSISPKALPPQPIDDRSIWSQRSRRKLAIFGAGATFMLISAAITRRAIARRNNWTRPLFFHTNMDPHLPPINAPLEALEALSVATINASSFGIMMTGGAFWAFDISSIAELRRRTRDHLNYEKSIEAEEKQASSVTQEEWMYNVLVDEDKKRKEQQDPKR
jgi:hypothetical protein